MAPSSYDKIVIFGDSLVEWSSAAENSGLGLVPALQSAYLRRLDVVNRGFDGYNTRQALKVLPQAMPSPEQCRVRLLIIFLGANDATLQTANNGFHVPISEYKENLRKIVNHPAVTVHTPKVMLITPPPIDEHKHLLKDLNAGHAGLTRSAYSAKYYAAACTEVGNELGLPVVNAWHAMMKLAGWRTGESLAGSTSCAVNWVLGRLISDGVHLTGEGYKVIIDALVLRVALVWPELKPEEIPYVFPTYDEFTGQEKN
ncbi:GDSL Lipase/Acylhydrolase family protein [Pseudomassariella vexata]|uniref:GDSL Lipase/Acylhydrolase family protein n=1 Tax=Pseudomassariella vexata TaxID=1141098 RepID=A0A1Y2EAT5_9PEZI|nr:GDSL Lipase/Acylhydrolase family protein [Pseudomassariella vexata]ORY68414.1 GDSL Lipase/Acylhydrolase family protein [Pseudomassariella vexata]